MPAEDSRVHDCNVDAASKHDAARFDLKRLLIGVTLVALVGGLFANAPWMISLAIAVMANFVAAIVFGYLKNRHLSELASLSCALFFGAFLLTDFGLSSPHPVVRVAWKTLIAAMIAQLATIFVWLLSAKEER